LTSATILSQFLAYKEEGIPVKFDRMRAFVRGAPARATLISLLIALTAACNSGGDEPVTLASCGATMNADGVLFFPNVAADDGAFSYTLTPLVPKRAPMQYTIERGTPSAVDCAPVTYSASKGGLLLADSIERLGQSVSLSLQPVPQSPDGLFHKVSGTAKGTLRGYAGGSIPLVGAEISVFDASGASLGTSTTNSFGAFSIYSESIPDAVKVVAKGGTRDGAPFAGTLQAQIENYTSVEGEVSIQLTAVTTLVGAYHDRYPLVTLDEAMDRVREQLEIPVWLDIDADDQSSGDYVDEAAFFAQAQAAGGVDALVQAVLTDWASATRHSFIPVGLKDSSHPSVLGLDSQDPGLAADCGPPSCSRPQEAAIAGAFIKAAQQVYAYHKGKKTDAFQADTISLLNSILAEVNQMSNKIDKLIGLALFESYNATRRNVTYAWETKARDGYRALMANVTTTRKPRPEGCPDIPAGMKVADTAYNALAAKCKPYAGDVIEFRGNVVKIDAMVENDNFEKPWDTFHDWVTSEGTGHLFTTWDRKVMQPVDEAKRTLFTYNDSAELWDHFRYWEDIAGVYRFFYVGFYGFAELPQKVTDSENRYGTFMAAARARMPRRQLSPGMYVDTFNKDYDGKVVGDPLVWWVTGRPFCNSAVNFPARFVNLDSDPAARSKEQLTQAAMRKVFQCLQSRPEAIFDTRWRLPNVREWEAFSQTANRPGRNVGQWLVDRRVLEGLTFNGLYFYATETGSGCPSYYAGAGLDCSQYSYYFPFSQASFKIWAPFIGFNILHQSTFPDVAPNQDGYVLPVRSTSAGEFYTSNAQK
jgi:hypothetical protein